jgi:hypothetical protein
VGLAGFEHLLGGEAGGVNPLSPNAVTPLVSLGHVVLVGAQV